MKFRILYDPAYGRYIVQSRGWLFWHTEEFIRAMAFGEALMSTRTFATEEEAREWINRQIPRRQPRRVVAEIEA